MSELFQLFSDLRTDMKELIKTLKELNNHLSTLKMTADSMEKFTKEMKKVNEGIDEVLGFFKELKKG